MLKRIKLLGWITILLLLFVIIAGMGQLTPAAITKTTKTTDKKAEKQQSEKYMSTKYPGLNIKIQTKETNTYTLAISTPFTENKQMNKAIQSWIKEQTEGFRAEIKDIANMLGDGHRAHLNIQVNTNKITDDIYSLVFNSYKYTGGANGINNVKVFNIDLKNNTILQIEDVLKINDDSLSIIKELVDEELQKDEDIYFYVMDDLLEEAINKPSGWNWSINNKAFTLYFDEYEIAAGAAGPLKVKIPLQKIHLYLNEDMDFSSKMPQKQQQEEKIQKEITLNPNEKYVALTFDDGPNPNVTTHILQTLKDYEAIATFFMLGTQVDYYPEIVKEVAKNGHEIGNHSMNHPDLTNMNIEQIHQEFENTNRLIEDAIGRRPTVIRPPYGATNNDVMKIAKNNESPIVLWSVDSLDWKSLDAGEVKKVVLQEIKPGSIVLLHDIHPTTADALPEILDTLKKDGYQFITVSQWLDIQVKSGIGPFYGG